MKRLLHLAAAVLSAVVAVLLLADVVRSDAPADRVGNSRHAAGVHVSPVLTGSDRNQPAADFYLTRRVTVTVASSSVALTPGLSSRWQIDVFRLEYFTGTVDLPPDASEITATVLNGEFGIDYSRPQIFITNSQGLYYAYVTSQQALRFGNQILISQTYRYNRPLHYISTIIFTAPYQYVGYAGYAPTQTTATEVYWDVPFTADGQFHQFVSSIWLVDPRLQRPELEIINATATGENDHILVTALVRNNGPITASAPSYMNLYDRLAPSTVPTGPLDLAQGWCSLTPFSSCGGFINPVPPVPPGQTVLFTTEYDLSPINGQHDIYLFIDALGGSKGLNVESAENNNVVLAGSPIRRGEHIFLPLIQRN